MTQELVVILEHEIISHPEMWFGYMTAGKTVRDLQSGNNRGKAGEEFERNNAANIGALLLILA
ncbi:MAG: hypothetical protein ACLR2G_04920 [Phascolarctobacterium faecium]